MLAQLLLTLFKTIAGMPKGGGNKVVGLYRCLIPELDGGIQIGGR